jgi:hypothetical protein
MINNLHTVFNVNDDNVVEDDNKVAQGNHFTLTGDSNDNFYVFDSQHNDVTCSVVNTSAITCGPKVLVLRTAAIGSYQLGTNSSNNGGALQSRQGGPLTSNGTLSVTSGGNDDDDDDDGGGHGGGHGGGGHGGSHGHG